MQCKLTIWMLQAEALQKLLYIDKLGLLSLQS